MFLAGSIFPPNGATSYIKYSMLMLVMFMIIMMIIARRHLYDDGDYDHVNHDDYDKGTS